MINQIKNRHKSFISLIISFALLLSYPFSFVFAQNNLKHHFERPQKTLSENVLSLPQAEKIQPPLQLNVEADKSQIMLDSATGSTFISKNELKKLHQSSPNYMMVALIAAEKLDLNKKHTVKNAGRVDSTKSLYFKSGDSVTHRDLLTLLVFKNSNYAANELAIAVSGSSGKFVSLMNKRAYRLSLRSTHFENIGYEITNTQTMSIKDFSLIIKECMKNQNLSQIMSLKKATITRQTATGSESNKKNGIKDIEVDITPLNSATDPPANIIYGSSFYSKEFTNVYAVVSDIPTDNRVICVVTENDFYRAVKGISSILDIGAENLQRFLIYDKGANVGKLTRKDGTTLSLIAIDGVSALLPNDYDKAGISEKIVPVKNGRNISAAKSGSGKNILSPVATLNVYYKGSTVSKTSLFSSESFASTGSLSKTTTHIQNGDSSLKNNIISFIIKFVCAIILWRVTISILKSLKRSILKFFKRKA